MHSRLNRSHSPNFPTYRSYIKKARCKRIEDWTRPILNKLHSKKIKATYPKLV